MFMVRLIVHVSLAAILIGTLPIWIIGAMLILLTVGNASK